MNFLDANSLLNQVGFYDVVLPWLLFFAIIYGLLQRVQIFGGEKNINAVISAAIAFFIINFTPATTTISQFFSSVFGQASMIMAVFLSLVLFMAILGFEKGAILTEGNIKYVVVLFILLVSYSVFSTAYGGMLNLGMSEETLTTIFTLLFIIFVVYFVSKGGNGSGGENKD